MNRKQLIVLWVLALWLAFAVVYSSYSPAYNRGEYVLPQEPTFNKLRMDPEFLALRFDHQRDILLELNSEFAELPVREQWKVITTINEDYSPPSWDFYWADSTTMLLCIPAILIAIPFFITFRHRA